MKSAIQQLADYGDQEHWSSVPLVAVHPLSDQIDLLNRLGISSNDCIRCDCYVVLGGELIFMEIEAVRDKPARVWHLWRHDVVPANVFSITTHECPLRTQSVTLAVNTLANWIQEHALVLVNGPPKPQCIIQRDICIRGNHGQ